MSCSASDPYAYEDYESTLRQPETMELLHQMDQESIVVLENHNGTLPLSKDIGSIALIGPQVDRVTVSFPNPLSPSSNTVNSSLCRSLATMSSSTRPTTPSPHSMALPTSCRILPWRSTSPKALNCGLTRTKALTKRWQLSRLRTSPSSWSELGHSTRLFCGRMVKTRPRVRCETSMT